MPEYNQTLELGIGKLSSTGELRLLRRLRILLGTCRNPVLGPPTEALSSWVSRLGYMFPAIRSEGKVRKILAMGSATGSCGLQVRGGKSRVMSFKSRFRSVLHDRFGEKSEVETV